MATILYDLCGEDPAVRFSPPCWIVKLALLHKGLDFETAPLGFTEKENYPDADYGRLPILRDGDALVTDSADIVAYLDNTYAERPLVATDAERAAVDFIGGFLGAYVFPPVAKRMFVHVHAAIRPQDRDYFRESREERLGMTLEAAADGVPDDAVAGPMAVLAAPLATRPFFGGAQPNLADYQVAGLFLWMRIAAPAPLFETPTALSAWFDRMLDLYDGYARGAPKAAA
ncbi:MAG: glutathione S-transferase N-terminal domain-containing protein [Pseudomonadota bacterium]